MLSPGESNIKDDDLCNILLNFIAKAANLLYYHNLLLSFKNILAQEELLFPDDKLDNVALLIGKSLTTKAPCLYMPALTLSWSNLNQKQ
jgi:hypothetical protein